MNQSEKTQILIVDDEEPVRRQLERLLEGQGYGCTLAADAAEARRCHEEKAFALMLCDVLMPGESGLDLAKEVLSTKPDVAVIIVTGVDDAQVETRALELGVYGYVVKPFRHSELLINVTNALHRRKLELENGAQQRRLEQTVWERTADLREVIANLEGSERELRLAQEETIFRLARAAEFRDDETAQHVQRMSRYAALLAGRLGWPAEQSELLRLASSLHDIGKIGTPDGILFKPGKLMSEELEVMRQHTGAGYRILTDSTIELLNLAASIAWTHHERYDGRGYPRSLAGEAIPLEGRIATVADVFDALTSKRVYKPAFPIEQTMDTMRQGRGTQFDPLLLDLFLESIDDVLAIRAQYADGASLG